MSSMTGYTRRKFLLTGFIGSAASLLVRGAAEERTAKQKTALVCVGTYTTGTKSEGIYLCRFDMETGRLSLEAKAVGIPDPSFLAVDQSGTYLFAVNELVEFENRSTGTVSSFLIDRQSKNLKLINKQASLGGAPCHITVTEGGRFILVANYIGGNISVFPIGLDGVIRPASDLIQHIGSGPNMDRQSSAHAHSITLDNKGRFAVASDLGIDKVLIYRFDPEKGKLTANHHQPYFKTKPGAGPRHFAFHPNGKMAFVINELDSSLTSLSYDAKYGTLKEIETVSTLSPEYSGANNCADVHVSPNGKFVYGSNRGSDSIAIFGINENNGKLTYIDNTPTGGKKPRNFAIAPGGNFLLAANQDSGTIVVFKIDPRSGRLQNTGNIVDIPAPVCLKFVPPLNSAGA